MSIDKAYFSPEIVYITRILGEFLELVLRIKSVMRLYGYV